MLPKRAAGIIWLGLSNAHNKIELSAQLPEEIKPNTTLTIPLSTNAKKGEVVEVWAALVDEGILSLTEYKTPDPLAFFFQKIQLPIEWRDLYGKIIDPMEAPSSTLKSGGDAALLRRIADFAKKSKKLVAFVHTTLTINEDGKANLSFDIPDYNGKVRIMAIAYSKDRLGSFSGDVLVRDPLVLEVTLPRFLTPDDQAIIHGNIHNITGPEGEYTLRLVEEGNDSAPLMEKKVTLKAEEKSPWNIAITGKKIGDMKLKMTIEGQGISLQKNFEIEVKPLFDRRFDDLSEKVESGKSLTLSLKDKITALGFTDPKGKISIREDIPWAVDGLLNTIRSYAYGCTEQLTTQGIGTLYQIAHTHDAADLKALNSQFDQLLSVLCERQNQKGGWSRWSSTASNDESDFITLYILDLLEIAERQKIPVPQFLKDNAMKWALKAVNRIKNRGNDNFDNLALALPLVAEDDTIDSSVFRYILDEQHHKFSRPSSFAHLGYALALRGENLRAQMAFSAAVEGLKDNDLEGSDYLSIKAEHAIVLRRLAEASAYMDVKNLLSEVMNRTALLMIEKPHHTSFESGVLIAATAALTKNTVKETKKVAWTLKVGETETFNLSQKTLSADDLQGEIVIKNTGDVPLWINRELSGLPSKKTPASSKAITFNRQFFDDKGAPINWKKIKQGDRITVLVDGEITTGNERSLVYCNLLPAGFEKETSVLMEADPKASNPLFHTFITPERVEIRDDRVLVAFSMASKGTFRFAYRLRVVTEGTFKMPFATIQDMFDSEVETFHALDPDNEKGVDQVVVKSRD